MDCLRLVTEHKDDVRTALRPRNPPTPGRTTRAPEPSAPALSIPAPRPDALAQTEAFAAQIRFDGGLTPANTARLGPIVPPSNPAVIEALVLNEISGDKAEAARQDSYRI